MYRQSHHVVVAAIKRSDPYVAYPFLYAVSSGLVEWFEASDVEFYLLVAKLSEGHVGGYREMPVGGGSGDGHSGDHTVSLTADGF